MPYAEGFFGELGECEAFESGKLSPEALASADVLLTRSTTKVDKALLQHGKRLKFIGTATAGINHFDIDAIEAQGITWTSAAGCNARAVAEYVLASLLYLAQQDAFVLNQKSVAIVGVGAVGRQVADIVTALGMQVLLYDPPRAAIDSTFVSASFDEVLHADIVSLHAPYTKSGDFPTKHMFNADTLSKMQNTQYLISASRGELIDTQALLNLGNNCPQLVMDCWEDEPHISTELVHMPRLATAHIAGHSLEGKARGTSILYDKLCEFLGVENTLSLNDFLPKFEYSEQLRQCVDKIDDERLSQDMLNSLVKCFYDIENDDSFFRQHMAKSNTIAPIRKNYPIRREFDSVRLSLEANEVTPWLIKLGFTIS